MTNEMKISSVVLIASLFLVALFSNSIVVGIVFIGSAALFGFLNWLTRFRDDRIASLESSISDVRERVSFLSIQRGPR